jgi:MoaA/NifB/PqqE/SkfB family radical SAM enzyme
MRSWRYFLEVNSACNLHCPSCTKGNKEGYDHLNGIMDWDLMLKCIDKIQRENPEAIVFLYGNSEPFLHPKLPEVIRAVRAVGLRCEFSSNLNYMRRFDEVLEAAPGMIIVSLSGFTQAVYEKGHAGGDIERVKSNLHVLATANQRHNVRIAVNYHVYNDNAHEAAPMEELCQKLGIGFFKSMARAISMENAIQYCRENDPEKTDFPGWGDLFPQTSPQWRETMARLKIPPTEARQMYARIPIQGVCPVGAGGMFTFIRHTGEASLCACVADRRITIGNYLEMAPEQMIEKRQDHAICQQCIRYRTNLYFHIVDRDRWEP